MAPCEPSTSSQQETSGPLTRQATGSLPEPPLPPEHMSLTEELNSEKILPISHSLSCISLKLFSKEIVFIPFFFLKYFQWQ